MKKSCKKCLMLRNLYKGHKARTILFDNSEESIDCNYNMGFIGASRDIDGNYQAYLKTEITIERTNRTYGQSIPIRYCPFCGNALYSFG